jgi:hypothetical protein
MRDPYHCLALPRTASAEEIGRSFRQLAKQLHPDVSHDPAAAARFVEVNAAYEILGNEKTRRAFDHGRIDGDGRRVRSRRFRMWRSAAMMMAVVVFAAVSLQIVQRLMPYRGAASSIGEARSEARSLPPDQATERVAGLGHGLGPSLGPLDRPSEFEVHLIAQQNDSYATNNTIPLSLQVSGKAVGLSLEIGGLPAGTTLSVGKPIDGGKWRILASDIGNAMIHPPQDFRGALDFSVELRLADGTVVDNGSFRLDWTPTIAAPPIGAPRNKVASDVPSTDAAPPAPTPTAAPPSPTRTASTEAVSPPLDREQIELLIGRSQQLMSEGDIAAARTLLRRAAEARDARAALALGATYDPIMLTMLQARGVAADLTSARDWYQKASELGSQEAQERLKLLASADADSSEPVSVGRVAISRSAEPAAPEKDRPSMRRRAHLVRHLWHRSAAPDDGSEVSAGGDTDPDPRIRSQLLRDDASRPLRGDSSPKRSSDDPVKLTATDRMTTASQ